MGFTPPPQSSPPLPALDAKAADPKLEFFLTASHQLKSPVSIIQWCLQSVLELQTVPPDAQKLIRKALEQADGMGHLITDMLQVFRLMSQKSGTETLESVSFNKIVDDVFSAYEMVAHNKGVHLVRGAIENVPAVMAKETLARQIVINLVDNAIKYTKPGGHVTVNLAAQKDIIEIKVSDEGIGIPDSERSRMFTEFFRGQEAKDLAYEGTGLGLVLVKHVVESLQGTIDFRSELHKGTTFFVRIPLKP
jgi:two-component system phosphate regulon sensor histidine kinase PhoR